MEKFDRICHNCKFCKPAIIPPRYEYAVCLHNPPISKVTGKSKPLFCTTERSNYGPPYDENRCAADGKFFEERPR